jgi:hypothetical protein
VTSQQTLSISEIDMNYQVLNHEPKGQINQKKNTEFEEGPKLLIGPIHDQVPASMVH